MSEDGWNQVKAGIALISWSRLASFDSEQNTLVAANEQEFEFGPGHKNVHHAYGRVICWIVFSIGGEYLAKGACLLAGITTPESATVIRGPEWDEATEAWSDLVLADDPKTKVADTNLGTLGKLPIKKIAALGPDRQMVSATMKYLASAIRNRDAHRYAPNVRAAHFRDVPRLFVPAFNALLRTLDQEELRKRIAG